MDKKLAAIGAQIVYDLRTEIKEGKYEGWGMSAGYVEAVFWWLDNIAEGRYEKYEDIK